MRSGLRFFKIFGMRILGHSFCRRCLKDAIRYSPKCPKCREPIPNGKKESVAFIKMVLGALNVNSVLWNTIRMLFPKTKDAPASPPDPSPLRTTTSRRQFRHLLSATEAEALRVEIDRCVIIPAIVVTPFFVETHENASHPRHGLDSYLESPKTRINDEGQPLVKHSDGHSEEMCIVDSPVHSRGPAITLMGRAQRRNVSGNESFHRSRSESIENHSHRAGSIRIRRPSSRTHTPVDSSTTTPLTTNETRLHRQDNQPQEMLSSECPWIQIPNAPRMLSGVHTAHRHGFVNSMNRSASHGDLHNDVEYVAVRRVQRVDQRSHQRHGVYHHDNVHHRRVLFTRDLQLNPVRSIPVDIRDVEFVEDVDFDEEDFESASELISDRDSSFTSSIAAPVGHSRANSFRYHDDEVSSVSTTAPHTETVASFGGYGRLYDISAQIEAARNQLERLAVQPGWSHRTDPSQPPATPLTHRSCFQPSDEEDEEYPEWREHIRDAVFIVDDLDTESESDHDSLHLPSYDDVDDSAHLMPEAWMGSVDSYY